MSQNYITLSRSALHELVWTKPVRDVAKEFGISDVAFAKRCRALKIPLPRPWLLGEGRRRPKAASSSTATVHSNANTQCCQATSPPAPPTAPWPLNRP